MQCGMWELSAPTRDWTQVPCFGSRVLAIGQPGKSPESVLGVCIFLGIWSFHLHYIIYCHTIAQSVSLQSLYCKSSSDFPFIVPDYNNLNLLSWPVLLKSQFYWYFKCLVFFIFSITFSALWVWFISTVTLVFRKRDYP